MSVDDNDIDDELLALAEGGSSEDEGDSQVIDDRSLSPETETVKPSVEKNDDSGVRRGVAQKVRAKRGRRTRRRDESEDEDDDEAFASSPDSFFDAEMRRSASVKDAAGSPASVQNDDAPLYPVEGKFTSQSDRTWLLSLPELEREQELDKRAQEVIRRQQDLQLKRALASNRATTTKRKAADADLDETARKSARPKMERGAKSALDKYKKMREQAGADRERRDGKRTARRDERSPSNENSERDADGESEVEWAEPTTERRRDEPLADLSDFNHCRVGRSNFAQICFFPGFEDAITGCFARVSVGPNRETGENMYRMALIKGFKEGKPYQLESSNGKKFLTDQYAVVAQGKSEKPWPFAACSDSKFTLTEMDRYIDTLKEQRLRIPTRKLLDGKLNDINKLLHRRWTDEDISAKIGKQKAIEKKYDPANAAELAREKILKRKQFAEDEQDNEEIARCNAELQALEANTSNGSALGRPLVPSRPIKGGLSEQDRLAQRNALTRKTNSEEVRKALLEERRKEIAARERAIAEMRAKVQAEEMKNRLQVPGGDSELFGDVSDVSRSGTPLNGVKKLKAANGNRSATPSSQNGVKQPIGALRSGLKNEDDIIGAMDLGIDIEI